MRMIARLETVAYVAIAALVIGSVALGRPRRPTYVGTANPGHSAQAPDRLPALVAGDVEAQPRVPPSVAECDHTSGWTPLHHAAFGGGSEAVADLLEQGEDPNARTAHGATPLHCGAYSGSPAIALALIEHGADVNARTAGGSTPLHLAVVFDQPAYVECLLNAGARSDAGDLDGLNPLDLALEGNRTRAAALLRAWGAEPNHSPARRPSGAERAGKPEEDAR
jgi:ankyrin repeat protein